MRTVPAGCTTNVVLSKVGMEDNSVEALQTAGRRPQTVQMLVQY